MAESTGIPWTDICGKCGTALTEDSRVERGRRLCKPCKNTAVRARYRPKGPPKRYGPKPLPGRDGDKFQARQRVNVEVKAGRLPHPNSLPCFRCGHIWHEGDPRHHYHHHNGYAAESHFDVVPVCNPCHAAIDSPKKAQTHCKRGHEFTAENTIWENGCRKCRECRRTRDRSRHDAAYWRRQRAQAAGAGSNG